MERSAGNSRPELEERPRTGTLAAHNGQVSSRHHLTAERPLRELSDRQHKYREGCERPQDHKDIFLDRMSLLGRADDAKTEDTGTAEEPLTTIFPLLGGTIENERDRAQRSLVLPFPHLPLGEVTAFRGGCGIDDGIRVKRLEKQAEGSCWHP